jgi:hypothetical protein
MMLLPGGAPVTVKLAADVAVPPGVMTLIGPLVALDGTCEVICVSELTMYAAAVPLNATLVAPLKPVPLIVTSVPAEPDVGVKPLTTGCGGGEPLTVKLVEDVPVPCGVVTLIGPLVAPDGTLAEMLVSELSANAAAVPLNVTLVAPVKYEPVIVTASPTFPLVGEKSLTIGAGGGGAPENIPPIGAAELSLEVRG